MRRSVVCFLLFVVYCFCISDSQRVRPTRSTCTGRWRQFCLSARGGNSDTDISNTRIARAARERREVEGGRGVEGRGGERGEGDDLQRSEFNDQRRQQSKERQLANIGNHQKHPAQHPDVSVIDRLFFLIAKANQYLDDSEKKWEKIQDEGRSNNDPDRQRVFKEIAAILENKS